MPQPTAMKPGARPSSAAPPSYRPKKNNPLETGGESNPMPQNKGRLTGPPMQIGAGQGSIFANGRPGGRSPVPYGAPTATPNYPRTSGMAPHGQMQGQPPMSPNYPRPAMGASRPGGERQGVHPMGNKTAVMFADGGFGAPPMIGGMPDDDDSQMGAPVGQPDDQGDSGAQGGTGMPVIRPEAVGYHDEPRACAGASGGPACMHFGQDGQCAVLKMMVSGPGGCAAYEAGGGAGEQDADMSQGMPTGASGAQNPEGTSGSPSMS